MSKYSIPALYEAYSRVWALITLIVIPINSDCEPEAVQSTTCKAAAAAHILLSAECLFEGQVQDFGN